MSSEPSIVPASKASLWAGWILSALGASFMLLDGTMKLLKPAMVVEATTKLGYPESVIVPLGVVLLACTIIYLFPRTAMLGAILLTGYLGGAVASHVRVSHSAFETIFPVIFGAILWGGLWFRDRRIRALVPWRS